MLQVGKGLLCERNCCEIETIFWCRNVITPTKATKVLSDFVLAHYDRLSQLHSGGQTLDGHTLNELRVEHAIGRAFSRHLPISNAALADSLGMSRSTVSRAILGLIKRGLIVESVDPKDRRRRILKLTVFGEHQMSSWIAWCNDAADACGIEIYRDNRKSAGSEQSN